MNIAVCVRTEGGNRTAQAADKNAMNQAGTIRRLVLLASLLAAGFAALGFMLVDLQVVRHEELSVKAAKNTRRMKIRQPLRGQIRDVRGNPLALSVPAKVVCADPSLLGGHQPAIARALAPFLETDEASLAARLQPRLREVNGRIVTNSYVVLKRKVPLETWRQIEQAMAALNFGVDEKTLRPAQKEFYRNLRKSVFSEEDQIRLYPNQRLAAHVIGHVGGDVQQGQNGVELSLNSKLAGVPGWVRTETDVRRRELVAYRDQDMEPRNGFNVVLTLDSGVQWIVENALAEAVAEHSPVSISAVVVRPRTGEILAMATLPNFDPNKPGDFPMESLRNRVITDIAEPGSTFKIVVVSSALNENAVRLTDVFDCEHGRFSYAGRILHDHGSYGNLTVEGIITKSSNIGAAKIGIQLGAERLHDYILQYGFARRTGIPLPGEVGGIVHPVKDWIKLSLAQIPMGHGIAVTPMQMLMAMSTIANEGRLMRPMLVSRLEDEAGNVVTRFEPQMVRQVISPEAARATTAALKTVVSPEGTAPKAKLDNYAVAGKTGTAHKVENGRYVNGKYFSSFIGFFPADDPELCISVVMDEPKNGYFGGQTAAPVFKNIAEKTSRYLNIRPDVQPEPAFKDAIAANLKRTHLSR